METRDYMVAVVECVGKRRITRNPKHVIIAKMYVIFMKKM